MNEQILNLFHSPFELNDAGRFLGGGSAGSKFLDTKTGTQLYETYLYSAHCALLPDVGTLPSYVIKAQSLLCAPKANKRNIVLTSFSFSCICN
jgi:hypothetical protein